MSDPDPIVAPETPGTERQLGLRVLVFLVGLVAFLPGLCSLLFAPMWLGTIRGEAWESLGLSLIVVVGPLAAVVLTWLVMQHARRNALSARDALYLLLAVVAIAGTWASYDRIPLNFH